MSSKKLQKQFAKWLNVGTEFHSDIEEQKRTRLISLLNLVGLLLIFPYLIIYNSIEGNYLDLYIIIPITLLFIVIFILNRKGKSQVANMLAMSSIMIAVYSVIFISENQTVISFAFILIAFGAVNLIRHEVVKNVILVISLISYILTEYYMSKYLPFRESEYFFLGLLLLFYYMALRNWDFQNKKYQKIIEQKNNQLQRNNVLIQQQSDELLKVQKFAHELELTQKQKDMDTVLASQAMQIKLKENIISQLSEIAKGENPTKEIRSVILELRGQAETQKKLTLLNENLEEVNSVLYERLLAFHPDLTKSEREMCAFIRLGLSVKEISSLKNITTNSANVLKSRLRKKLNLNSNHELGPYLLKY